MKSQRLLALEEAASAAEFEREFADIDIPYWASVDSLAYHLVFDEPTPSNNIIKGYHFRQYQTVRRRWRERVLLAIGSGKPEREPLERFSLVVVRGSAGYLDFDNMAGGLKPMLDCLVLPTARNPDGLGLVADDKREFMVKQPYLAQLKAAPGAGFTEVFIFSI